MPAVTQLRRRVNTGFALALVALVISSAVALYANDVYQQAADQRQGAYQRRVALNRMFSILQDAETGQRGYLLTGRPEYLEPYRRALVSLAGGRHRVTPGAGGDTSGVLAWARLDTLARAKLDQLAASIRVADGGNREAARQDVAGGRGELLMDSIRAVVASLGAHDEQALRRAQADVAHWHRMTRVTNGVLTGLAVAFLAIGLVLINLDISRGARAETRLRDSEYRLSAILDALPVGVFVVDGAGRAQLANRKATELLGRGLVPGVGVEDLPQVYAATRASTGASYPPGEQPLSRALAGQTAYADDFLIRQPGRMMPLEVWASPVIGADGVISHAVAAFNDITERTTAARRLHQALLAAEAASRAKSGFVALMSHELRTPLNSIIGFSEMLHDESRGPLNDTQRRYVGNVLASGRQLLDLINDILDLAKIEAGRMDLETTGLDVAAMLTEVHDTLAPLAGRKAITLATDVPPGLPTLRADPARFRQMLHNLVNNAIKYTPEGGRVTVTARNMPIGEGSGELEVAVEDNGIGIAAADLERIFEPFEQAAAAYVRQQEGTGLGLALTRRLAEMHGGRITVESRLDVGSTFRLRLPWAGPPVPVTDPADRGDTSGLHRQGDGPHILIVDDEPRSGDLLAEYLDEAGYRITVATTGSAALEMARRLQPAAITLDVLLPDHDGLGVLARLKSDPLTRHIPVIIISISEDRTAGFSLGATEWFVKPVKRDTLLAAVRKAVPHTTATALVVDDEDEARELLRSYLDAAGYRVITAAGGRDGIARALRDRPDMLILDLLMPDLTGFDVVQALRAHPDAADLPILVCTAADVSEFDRNRLRDSVQAIVTKGAVRERLLAEVRRVLGRPA